MEPIVDVAQGRLSGVFERGVWSFKGVPYAAAPFGPRRFQAPGKAPAWDGVRSANEYGPTAPKPPYYPPMDLLLAEPIIAGEDCLNLNIWTPDPQLTGLPVLVWIHGGAFVNGTGAAPRYDGTEFARDGVVCVTINYRLGVDGFLLLDDVVSNRGLLDQIAALDWVRDNIQSFGGDPDEITVAGGSSGAMSVMTLISMPATRGLFRRAIAQSGAAQHVLSAATARQVTSALAQLLGVEPRADGFAAVLLDRLIEAQSTLSMQVAMEPDRQRWGELASTLMAFAPVIDGHVLQEAPMDQLRRGVGADVELLIGTNSDEQNLFLIPGGGVEHVTEDLLSVVLDTLGADVESTLGVYRASRPLSSPGELLSDLLTDWSFRIPAIRVAEVRTALGQPTYVYEFGWRSPQFDGRLGACHALEIGFVFGTIDQAMMRPLVGEAATERLAETVHRIWVDFIAGRGPGWSPYTSKRAVMFLDDECALVDDPAAKERKVWEGIR